MSKVWKVGTRKSQLALWQARETAAALDRLGAAHILVEIESSGDQNLTQPLYAMGIQGVFTKELDTALLNGQIDLAVHSLKDVPTQLASGTELAGVLPRGKAKDILVYTQNPPGAEPTLIASGSLRRRAQWLHRYPKHQFENLRGNVQTRLKKLEESSWGGAIFAEVGLERVGLLPQKYQVLDWMIPAAAQGAVGICIRERDHELKEIIQQLNCESTWKVVHMERQFLRILEGGCSAPIGVFAEPQGEGWKFKAGLFSTDGKDAIVVEETIAPDQWQTKPKELAEKVWASGGKAIISAIKN